MLRALVLFSSFLTLGPSAVADSIQPFFNLVEIRRDANGNVYEIMIRPDLPAKPLDIVKSEVLASVQEQKQLGVMQNPIPLSGEKLPGEREFNEYRKLVQKIIHKLEGMDLEVALKNASLKKFLEEFQSRLLESTRDFQVIARLDDSKYFRSNQVLQELLKRGLKEAMENLPGTVAGVAAYIISEAVRMLVERRTYYQNFVAHYLLSYSPTELGLTEQEVARAKSSIHESYSAWNKPWESEDIDRQWDTYGTKKYNEISQRGENNWKRERRKFDSSEDFYNFAFVPVKERGVYKIKNMINPKSQWSKNLSTAFNYDKPCEQIGFRFIVRLIEFGVYQIPIPDILKKLISGTPSRPTS